MRRHRRQSPTVGVTEAQLILGVGKCLLYTLIKQGRLPARLDTTARRCYIIKRPDVDALAAQGGYRKYNTIHRKRVRILWERHFGPIPDGFFPAFRDGNRRNVSPENLCLKAKKPKTVQTAQSDRRAPERWTKQQVAILRREYARCARAEDLVGKIGKPIYCIRQKARKLKIRRNWESVCENARKVHGYPIGAERVFTKSGDKTDIVYVKVSHQGAYHLRWRPKHHLAWEQANGCPLPPRNFVLFKDGNRRNFDPANLVALTREESSALANIQFHSALPKGHRDAIRLISRIEKEANRQLFGSNVRKPPLTSRKDNKGGARKGECRGRWTPGMDEVLRRDYPSKMRWDVAASLGVTELAARLRARRLMIQREPETLLAEARARAAGKASRNRAVLR